MSASWRCISLSKEAVESGEIDIIRALFRGGFVACNGPSGAALYGGWGDGGTTYRLYFTPPAYRCARALFKVYASEQCDAPELRRLEWLYGDPRPQPQPRHGKVF